MCQRRTPPYPPQALHEKPQRYGSAKVRAVPSPRNPAHSNPLPMLLRRLKVDIAHRSDPRSIWSVARVRRTAPHRTAPHRTAPRHATPHRTTPHRATPLHATPRHTTPHHATPHRAATRPSCPRNSTGSTASVKYMPPRRSLTHPNQLPVAAPPLEN